MQYQSEDDFEQYLDERLTNYSEEEKQKTIQQLDELFELLIQIFAK